MAEVKLTKTELRIQQGKLSQLQKYLPTLQLKKALLQIEVQEARQGIAEMEKLLEDAMAIAGNSAALLSEPCGIYFQQVAKIESLQKHYENIAGVEVPYFDGVTFAPLNYTLYDTPAWLDAMIREVRKAAEAKAEVDIAHEKKAALEKELREVSIRVNLFEKILIPRCLADIKKIKVFLGDQLLAAVSQAKVAKAKIEEAKNAH